MVPGSIEPVTEISTRNLPEGKADICEPTVYSLDVSQSCGPPRPVTRIALPITLSVTHVTVFGYLDDSES
jgi:hypothetical protein